MKKIDLRDKRSKRKIVKENRNLFFTNLIYRTIIDVQNAQMGAMKQASILTPKLEKGGIVVIPPGRAVCECGVKEKAVPDGQETKL